MAERFELTDKQWAFIKNYIPKGKNNTSKGGRPREDDRKLLSGMLWVLRTGAPWTDMPKQYGSSSTAHRRFVEWVHTNIFEKVSLELGEEFNVEEWLEDDSWQMDSTVVRAHRSASGAPKKSVIK